MAKTPAVKKPAAKKPAAKKPAKKTSVPVVKAKAPKKPKLPWGARFRLAWHVLKGNDIYD